jgi:hypothetical protein
VGRTRRVARGGAPEPWVCAGVGPRSQLRHG